ncbi:hypothetical protein CERSUDRAFT_82221 [Gelatoporia subvermispora B]|uniref:Uncharacterized protein n=1 Tax=Ceriporiopsis subvermispora (strain B) TaxID=914234 RepID=M2PNL8_CERS8|nr:hypothetical protein CERSUDRAFT_82221 [Gelatoporia subvermispora B]
MASCVGSGHGATVTAQSAAERAPATRRSAHTSGADIPLAHTEFRRGRSWTRPVPRSDDARRPLGAVFDWWTCTCSHRAASGSTPGSSRRYYECVGVECRLIASASGAPGRARVDPACRHVFFGQRRGENACALHMLDVQRERPKCSQNRSLALETGEDAGPMCAGGNSAGCESAKTRRKDSTGTDETAVNEANKSGCAYGTGSGRGCIHMFASTEEQHVSSRGVPDVRTQKQVPTEVCVCPNGIAFHLKITR